MSQRIGMTHTEDIIPLIGKVYRNHQVEPRIGMSSGQVDDTSLPSRLSVKPKNHRALDFSSEHPPVVTNRRSWGS